MSPWHWHQAAWCGSPGGTRASCPSVEHSGHMQFLILPAGEHELQQGTAPTVGATDSTSEIHSVILELVLPASIAHAAIHRKQVARNKTCPFPVCGHTEGRGAGTLRVHCCHRSCSHPLSPHGHSAGRESLPECAEGGTSPCEA